LLGSSMAQLIHPVVGAGGNDTAQGTTYKKR
jgi:hypothetical protein